MHHVHSWPRIRQSVRKRGPGTQGNLSSTPESRLPASKINKSQEAFFGSNRANAGQETLQALEIVLTLGSNQFSPSLFASVSPPLRDPSCGVAGIGRATQSASCALHTMFLLCRCTEMV